MQRVEKVLLIMMFLLLITMVTLLIRNSTRIVSEVPVVDEANTQLTITNGHYTQRNLERMLQFESKK